MIVYNSELKKLSYERKVGTIKGYNTTIRLIYSPVMYLDTAKRTIYSQIYIKQVKIKESVDRNFDYEFWYQLGAISGMYYRVTHHTYKNKERIPFYHSRTPFPQKILNYFNEWEFTATTKSRYSTFFFLKKFKKSKWYKYVKDNKYHIPLEALQSKQRLYAFLNGLINIMMGKGLIYMNDLFYLTTLKILLYSIFGVNSGIHPQTRKGHIISGRLIISPTITDVFDIPNFDLSKKYKEYYEVTSYYFLSLVPTLDSSAVYELPDGWSYLLTPDVVNGIAYKI